MVYARRHAVNEYFLRVFAFFIILILTENAVWLLVKSKKSGAAEASVNVSTASNTSSTSKIKLNQRGLAYILAAAAILLFICSAPFIRIKDNALKYFVRQDKTYALDLTEEFLAEVDAIPEDAQIYTFGWWQEPNVTVFLDRDMEDIEDNMYMGKKPEDGSYFITGQAVNNFSLGLIERVLGIRLIRVDQTEVDYSRYTTPFDRADMEYFAIYKIEK